MTSHGSHSTYTNHRCRCDACREAHRKEIDRQRQQRFAKPIPGHVEHGLETTRVNWLCTCWKCTTAHYVYGVLRRDKKAGLW